MRRLLTALISLAALAATIAIATPPADAQPFPETIDLPEGMSGEGIAAGTGTTFYAGSLTDGRIAKGDLRSGQIEVLVDEPAIVPSVGLWADTRSGLLFAAGGPSGSAAVYDLDTGETLDVFDFAAPGTSFINDVVVAGDAAYFTDSRNANLYVVPLDLSGFEVLSLSGPAAALTGAFNNNGIEATENGKELVVVNAGVLALVDPDTGDSVAIDVDGDMTFPTGDGLFLQGRTLYVLQNGAAPGTTNQVVEIRLSGKLDSGTVVDTFSSPSFETATTLIRSGGRFAAVNAQFAGSPIDAPSEVVIFDS